MSFTKYPALVEVENHHGIAIGNTYTTEHKCREFTCIIGETMRDEILASLKQAKYFSILMDGSTDSSVIEKELIYVMYVNSSGKPEYRFFGLKDGVDATATGVKTTLEQAFAEVGISDLSQQTVCLCVDGAAVNLGVRRGLAAQLLVDMPWLVAIHCLNHRLELGVKDALAKTNIDEISAMLVNLYYMYENSPKRLRELKSIGEIMEESVNKPVKAQGTR